MTSIRFAETCFRWIMRAYPARFRRAHGLALFEVFRDEARAAQARGGAAPVVRVLAAAAWDALASAPGAWLARDAATGPRSPWFAGWGHDLRLSLRQLRRSPGFLAITSAMLAVGIGANLTVFNVANAALLRPLALVEPDRVVRLTARTESGLITSRFVYQEFVELESQRAVFAAIAALTQEACVLSADGRRDEILAEVVSGSYLPLLGARPVIGRLLGADDDAGGSQPDVAISEHLWRRRFGSDPAIVGRSLLINGTSRTVVGVVAATFGGSFVAAPIDAWLPLATSSPELGANWRTDTARRRLLVVARLQAGVSTTRAANEIQFVTNLAGIPAPLRVTRVDVVPGTLMFGQQREMARVFLGLLLGLVALVLLVVCANVANLMLVRLLGRRRELAIRKALGASRTQLIRLLSCESVVIAVLGVLGAVVVAQWTTAVLTNIQPLPTVSLRIDTRFDWRVAAFALATAAGSALVLIGAGAIEIARPQLRPALAEDSGGSIGQRSTNRLRGALVAVQVTVSLLLLIGATLFGRSVRNAERIDLGFEPHGVVVVDVDRSGAPNADAGRLFFERVVRRLANDPNVEAVAVATRAPLDSSTPITHFDTTAPVGGRRGGGLPTASVLVVSPAYFDVVRTPIVAGRAFASADTAGAPTVAIVNETLARKAWPNESPIGKRIWLEGHAAGSASIVVGVARNSRYVTLGEESQAHIYIPFAQQPRASMAVLVRSREQPDRAISLIQDALQSASPGVQGFFARTLAQHASVSLLPIRLAARLALVVAAVGAMLAMAGLYALVAFMVSERRQEIGLRLALGATPTTLVGMIVRSGLYLVVAGLGVGIPLALTTTRLLRSLLYGVSAVDVWSFAAVTAVVVALGALASAVPALRVATLDPLNALRHL